MTGETDDAVVRGEASAEQTRRTNPNRIVYFALRVLAANFKKTYTSFFMLNIVVTIIRNDYIDYIEPHRVLNFLHCQVKVFSFFILKLSSFVE